MTVIHIPLPTQPLPDVTPCSGLWALFDSRRREDHWKARKVCKGCPLRSSCKPPERITVPSFPGTMGRPSAGTAASADGTWGGRLYHDGQVVDASLELSEVEACPTCGATPMRPCTTKSGKTTMPHKKRRIPRLCSRCGNAPSIRRGNYCAVCRAANDQESKNTYLRQQRARGAA